MNTKALFGREVRTPTTTTNIAILVPRYQGNVQAILQLRKWALFSPKINNNFDPDGPNELKMGSNLEEHEWNKMLGTKF